MMDIGKELQAAFDDGYAARDKEIVRCGECKYWEEESTFCLNKEGCYGSETTADWFCADGERKEQDDARTD